ncbi:phage tail spike protein [Siminovitchia terrae]|uniref:phage tail spike protein n=1 Tax=Siminovitchia terrae TaxID=1914933 RepID=UPI0028A65B11|nr:phage tail spike protein [Siminovitchia terrae]
MTFYLQLDGVNDYLEIPSNPLYTNTGAYEVSFRTSTPSREKEGNLIFGKYNGEYFSTNGIGMYVDNGGFLLVQVKSDQTNGSNYHRSSMQITDGLQHVVKIEFFDQQTIKVYIDGTLDGIIDFNETFDSVPTPIRIGKSEDTWWGMFKGDMFYVKVYNDVNNLVGEWDFRTGTVSDQTLNNNNATLIGGTWVDNSNTNADEWKKYSSEIYILSQDDKPLTTLSESTGLVSAPFKDQLNNVPDEPFVFTVYADIERAKYVKEENRVVFRDKDGDLREYVIKEIDDLDNNDGPQTTATCEPAFMELNEHVIEDRRFVDKEAQEALTAALQGTRWTGTVEVSLGKATTNFYYISSVDAIWNILEVWGGEFKDVVTFDGNKITKREIRIKQRLGADRGAWFEIDHNIEEIERTVLSYPVTALYGRGASLEIEDEETGEHTGGYTRLIDFADVEWKKSKGDPVDKPKGQKWVGDPDALLKYGRKYNGQLMHRYGIFENGDYEDPAELLWATWQQLQEEKKPEVNYRLAVHLFDKPVSLGDTARAFDRQFTRPIEIQTRVIAIEYDLLDIEGTTVVEMGQFLSAHDDDLYREIEGIKNDLNKPRPTKPIDNGSFPDVKPGTPVNVEANGAFQTIQLFWDYDSKVYISHYEVYGSQVKDFIPDSQHLLWRGSTSAFNHEVNTDQVWHYRVRAVNTRGTPGDFSPQVSAATVRIITDDILFGSIIADHLTNNLDIADKLAQNTIDRINVGPMQEIQYTQAEIQATENRLLGQLNSQIGDVNASINDLLTRTSGIEGTVTSITQEVNDVDGRLSTTITQLSNVDGVVSEHTTTLQQHAGLISAKAEKGEVYTRTQTNDLLGNKVDYTVYNNKMTSLDIDISGISNKVSNTETSVNSLTGELANAKSQIAQLNIRADGIVQSVSEVRADLDGLEIGGRNLASRNNIFGWESGFARTDNTFRLTGLKAGLYIHENTYEPDTDYVFSFKFKKISGTIKSVAGHAGLSNISAVYRDGVKLSTSSWSAGDSNFPDDGNVYSYVVYFKTKPAIGTTNDRIYIQPNRVSPSYAYEYVAEVWDLQLEKGNKATGWSPAPEDTDARITSAETLIEQKADKLALSAVSTSVDSLTGRMSNAESSINLLSNEIIFKVNKDGVIASINVSPEGVRISGNKHHITGQTLIDDAVIGTAAIADLAVTNAKLANLSVGTAQMQNLSVTNAKIASLAVDDAKIADLSVTKLKAGTIDTSKIKIRGGSAIDYTLIDGSYFESRGRFRRTWLGKTKTHDIRMRFENGYMRARNDTENHSLYFTDFGISTYADGEGPNDGASGTLAFRDDTYSSALGVTLHSNSGVVALKSESNRVVLDSGQTVSIESKNASVYLRPMRLSRPGNNEFQVWLKDNPDPGDVDGAITYGSGATGGAGHGSGIRFKKSTTGEPTVWITDGDGNKNTGTLDAYLARLYGLYTRNIRLDTSYEGTHFYLGVSTGELRVTSNLLADGNYRAVRASSFPTGTSLRENKTDIEVFNEDVLPTIRNASPYLYRIKGDEFKVHKQLGLMVDETPRILHGESGDSMEMYALNTFLWRGIQQLDDKVTDNTDEIELLKLENQYLKQKIKQLEDKVA